MERAKAVAQAYMEASQPDWQERMRVGRLNWPRSVEWAARDLLPKTDHWAVHEGPDSVTGLGVVAADGRALYRLAVVSADQRDPEVTVRRIPVEGTRVNVDERIAADEHGDWHQQRRWSFGLDGSEELTLETDQPLPEPGFPEPGG